VLSIHVVLSLPPLGAEAASSDAESTTTSAAANGLASLSLVRGDPPLPRVGDQERCGQTFPPSRVAVRAPRPRSRRQTSERA
jgi:hypothetical protein